MGAHAAEVSRMRWARLVPPAARVRLVRRVCAHAPDARQRAQPPSSSVANPRRRYEAAPRCSGDASAHSLVSSYASRPRLRPPQAPAASSAIPAPPSLPATPLSSGGSSSCSISLSSVANRSPRSSSSLIPHTLHCRLTFRSGLQAANPLQWRVRTPSTPIRQSAPSSGGIARGGVGDDPHGNLSEGFAGSRTRAALELECVSTGTQIACSCGRHELGPHALAAGRVPLNGELHVLREPQRRRPHGQRA